MSSGRREPGCRRRRGISQLFGQAYNASSNAQTCHTGVHYAPVIVIVQNSACPRYHPPFRSTPSRYLPLPSSHSQPSPLSTTPRSSSRCKQIMKLTSTLARDSTGVTSADRREPLPVPFPTHPFPVSPFRVFHCVNLLPPSTHPDYIQASRCFCLGRPKIVRPSVLPLRCTSTYTIDYGSCDHKHTSNRQKRKS